VNLHPYAGWDGHKSTSKTVERPQHQIERKLRLRQLIRASRNRSLLYASLLYASHLERHGVRLFQAICQRDCEGIVGKYKRGTYTTAPISWVKILNPSYSQKRGRDEMFENFRERGAAAGSPA
jgi:hypothetical protein